MRVAVFCGCFVCGGGLWLCFVFCFLCVVCSLFFVDYSLCLCVWCFSLVYLFFFFFINRTLL